MKKYLLLFVLVNIFVFNAHSQIQIHLDSLELRQISVTLHNPNPGSFMNLGYGSLLDMGPNAIFHLSITNKTDTSMLINYNEWIFGYCYSYKGKTYNSDFYTFMDLYEPFIQKLLLPEETFPFILKDYALLDVDIRRNKKDGDYDFSKDMLEVIPTIRVYAISPNRQIFFSDQPQKIVIKKKEPIKNSNYEYRDILNIKKFLRQLFKQ